jgi:hypothetical protein
MPDAQLSRERLAGFLWAGYFLDSDAQSFPVRTNGIDKGRFDGLDRPELVDTGVDLLRAAIAANFQAGSQPVIPLSGGLDSRAILAGLLQHVEARNIQTYTFGTPGTYDFEIGRLVAARVGTRHESFDLTQYRYDQAELEDISRRVRGRTVLFHHAPVWQVDRMYAGCEIWSGFLGDPLAGSHLQAQASATVPIARARFIERNRYVKSIDLTPPGLDLGGFVDFAPVCTPDQLTLDEQIDFAVRQTGFVAPHVLMRGFTYRLPFLYPPWVDFMLSVDNRYRRGQSLYKDILVRAFPDVFSLATKTNRGLPLGAARASVNARKLVDRARRGLGMLSRTLNYLDFDRQIRQKPDLRQVIESNVRDFAGRGLVDWTDVTGILESHMSGKARHSDALLVLASLEIHLKSAGHRH